ncbi:hypothetical protein V8C35DRAFT_62535 [Trichoderma chlorosporum]
MNWMGGNLSRHRRGKTWKEDMARQKEYFARARCRQRDGVASIRVPLTAANFIPNYASPSEAATSPEGAAFPPSTRISNSSCTANVRNSTSLDDPSQGLQADVTERPLRAPLGKNQRPLMLDVSSEDDSIRSPEPETQRRACFRKSASARDELLKNSVPEPTRKKEKSTHFERTFERRKQPRASTDHHKRASIFDRPTEIRRRKANQDTSSSLHGSLRIRVGSQDYRWSAARNSIGNPTLGDYPAISSIVPGGTTRQTHSRSVSTASYITSETFTGISPPSSDLPWSSPCVRRATRHQELYNSPKAIVRADSAELQRPRSECACGAVTKSSSSLSEIESTDSIAVQVGGGEVMPETEADEERIWRQWLG